MKRLIDCFDKKDTQAKSEKQDQKRLFKEMLTTHRHIATNTRPIKDVSHLIKRQSEEFEKFSKTVRQHMKSFEKHEVSVATDLPILFPIFPKRGVATRYAPVHGRKMTPVNQSMQPSLNHPST